MVADLNSEGAINILDIITLVNLVLAGEYESMGDINGDDELNILDIISLVNLILSDVN